MAMETNSSKKSQLEPLNDPDSRLKYTADELVKMMDYQSVYSRKGDKEDEITNPIKKLLDEKVNEDRDAMIRKLNSNRAQGIEATKKDLEERRNKYGSNVPKERKVKTVCQIIGEQLSDTFVILLLIAAAVSLAIGIWKEGIATGWIDGLSIFIAVTIITVVNTVNESGKEKQFQALMNEGDKAKSTVIRNSVTVLIDSEELLVGDIVKIENSKKIQADCVLIEAKDMLCAEADLTGESKAIGKIVLTEENKNNKETIPFIFKGTITQQGDGWGLVVCVGSNSNVGRMDHDMDFEKDATPLQ